MTRRGLIIALCVGVTLCRAAPAVAGDRPTEQEIKAAVAFNILQFVTWPAEALPPGQPLVLCAAEGSESAGLLLRYEGRQVRGTTLSIKVLNRHLERLSECQAVFVEEGNPYTVLQLSAASHERPLLVIAEGDNALQQGAGIGVSLAGSHVVIDVDLAALKASGLTVSSKLLRLARTVIK